MVASNPEVLAKLMRDANERNISNQKPSSSIHERIPNPAGYTIPASSLNTITVDFASSRSQMCNARPTLLTKTPKTASKNLDNKNSFSSNNANIDRPSHTAFIGNVKQVTHGPDIAAFTSSNTYCYQQSHLACTNGQSISEVLSRDVDKDNHVQTQGASQKQIRDLNGHDVHDKQIKEQKTNIVSSFLSTFNSSVINHQNVNKVKTNDFCTK